MGTRGAPPPSATPVDSAVGGPAEPVGGSVEPVGGSVEPVGGEAAVVGPAESPTAADQPPAEPFETFYRAYADRVYRALAITLGDTQLAREAADEAMARAYAHWRRVCHHDNPGGWAYRVGLNWATSWWRKVRRERALVGVPEPAAPAPDPVGAAALAALARLDLPHRSVVVCRVLLDLSTARTAAVLGTPEGTVKSRLARALATLRADLDSAAASEEER